MRPRTGDEAVGHAAGPPTKQNREENYDDEDCFALALAIAALATVPASAGKGCQEDLGYGRTSSFGCGG